MLTLVAATLVSAVALIPNEKAYLPVLCVEVVQYWPEAPEKDTFPAQVQQETCPSLKSKKCWSPTAELKTSREYGFGLGQITVTKRFDNFKEAKKLDRSLANWTWEGRYNAQFQLRTLVLTNKFNYSKLSWAADSHERLALTFASYNGGLGGVLSDRGVCKATSGCDPSRWFNNIAKTSKKSKVTASGYGESFFSINRKYVSNIMFIRRERYGGFCSPP